MHPKHTVYLLQSEKILYRFYMGYTTNLSRRIREHNKATKGHTALYKPLKIQITINFGTKSLAKEFEAYLKSHSGRAFLKKHFSLERNEELKLIND